MGVVTVFCFSWHSSCSIVKQFVCWILSEGKKIVLMECIHQIFSYIIFLGIGAIKIQGKRLSTKKETSDHAQKVCLVFGDIAGGEFNQNQNFSTEKERFSRMTIGFSAVDLL